MVWILTGILIIGIMGIKVAMWYTRPRVHCPQCNSNGVTVVRKEPLELRTQHYHSGLQGDTFIQTQYRVDYRCNQCQAAWTQEISESS